MSSTTGDKRVPLRTVLAISAALQLAGAVLFYSIEPLRKSHLAAGETREASTVDRAAKARLQKLEDQRKIERENKPLKPKDAEALTRKAEREKVGEITAKLNDMKTIRDELAVDKAALMRELSERTVEEIGLYLFDQIHPLGTQLVANAHAQRVQADLPAAPSVEDASMTLLTLIETEREKLMQPEVFEHLRKAHGEVQSTQQHYIAQLDEAQLAYTNDLDRIRRDNHAEYLVNLMRDQIAGLLSDTEPVNPATMNDLPPDYETAPPLDPEREQAWAEMSVADLQREAQSLFDDIRNQFAGARAAELALEQHGSLAKALAQVSVPAPPLGSAPAMMNPAPQSVGELNATVASLGQASREVTRLWQNARNMGAAGRGMAGQTPPTTGDPSGGAGRGGRGARGVGLARAAEGRAGRFADLTPFMYHSGSGEKGYGSSMGGGLDLTQKGIRTGFAETGPGTPGAKGPPLLSEEKVIKEALPGRRFSRTSPRTGWLYLDTWYVIGPWENHGRLGFQETWPPETLVNLDATYQGKGDRTLAWRFHQSDNIRIKPPDEMESSTYYGYTEVYFEEQMEMLVAVASDDAAKVWLNGQLIWQDDGMGPWRLDEGFRKVIFKQGFNTLLVRVENGPITCTYSILLCPPEIIPGV